MKPKIIFYKKRSDIRDIPKGSDTAVMSGECTLIERKEMLHHFENGRIKMLYVSSNMIHSFRVNYYADECNVEFVGDNWQENEILQGKDRVKPTILRDFK